MKQEISVKKAKKAIRQAFDYQKEGKCFSFVEIVSTCPTNWGLTPVDAIKWSEENMLPYYELGELKTPEPTEAQRFTYIVIIQIGMRLNFKKPFKPCDNMSLKVQEERCKVK